MNTSVELSTQGSRGRWDKPLQLLTYWLPKGMEGVRTVAARPPSHSNPALFRDSVLCFIGSWQQVSVVKAVARKGLCLAGAQSSSYPTVLLQRWLETVVGSVNLVILIWGSWSSKDMVFSNCSDNLVNKRAGRTRYPLQKSRQRLSLPLHANLFQVDKTCYPKNRDTKTFKSVGVCLRLLDKSSWIEPQQHRAQSQETISRTIELKNSCKIGATTSRVGKWPPRRGEHLCQLAPRWDMIAKIN